MNRHHNHTKTRNTEGNGASSPHSSKEINPLAPLSKLKKPFLSPPLDLAAVNRDYVSLPSSTFHHKGVTHCPIYYPNALEFADPLSFISSVRPEAQLSGICKIVPPKDWIPGFAIDTTAFRFKTRKQPLNEMEGGSRAALNFLDTLQKFHALMGHPMNHLPVLQKESVDLFALRNEVRKRGGFQSVTDAKKWNDIARTLGYHMNNSISGHLKSCYAKFIIAFDEYMINDDLDHNAPSPAADAMAARDESVDLTRRAAREARARIASVEERLRQINSVVLLSNTEAPGPDLPSFDASESAAGMTSTSTPCPNHPPLPPRRSIRASALIPSPRPVSPNLLPYRIPPEASLPKVLLPDNYHPRPGEELCESCGHGHNPQLMVVCSDCGRGYHAFCLLPSPLPAHPRTLSEWYCHACVRGTAVADFGFEDGEEYTFFEFSAKANRFKLDWFAKEDSFHATDRSQEFGLPPGSKAIFVTEEEVEREFWRIVESPAFTVDPVEVEYGADLHTSIHGSGFPTLERDPINPYTNVAMNLNVLPTLPKSLLQYIRKGISGCVVPWLYVGMTFSTFCWHSEDHDMYSINYQHWGDTKTWYAVPSSHADDFENVMRTTAPDLFAKTPDLLFHITTMLSPAKLVNSHVPVFGCHQRPGEFVVTFPRAYHSGFNHGFNCNEAVNFAPHDWLPWGAESVIRYKRFHKSPVFAHQDILMNIALCSGHEYPTAVWLGPYLRKMLESAREEWAILRRRSDASQHYVSWELEYLPDPLAPCETQCAICRQFCWYAAVRCPVHDESYCMDHADICCSRLSFVDKNESTPLVPSECCTKTVLVRYAIDVLDRAVTAVEDVANIPLRWAQQLQVTLLNHAKGGTRPSVNDMSAIIAQQENLSLAPNVGLSTLHSHLVRCLEWNDSASKFIKRRGSRKVGATSVVCSKIMEEVQCLLEDASSLYLQSPEVTMLDELLYEMTSLARQGDSIIERSRRAHISVDECNKFLQLCIHLDLQNLPQFQSVTSLVRELEWRQKAIDPLVSSDYSTVMQLIEEAKMLGLLPSNNALVLDLAQKAEHGEMWNQRTLDILSKDIVQLDDLDELVASAVDIPVSVPYRTRVLDLQGRIHSWNRSAATLINAYQAACNTRASGHLRSSSEDLRTVLAQMNELPIAPPPFHDLLSEELRRVDIWNLKCKKLFVRPNTPKSLEIVLTEAYIHIQPTCDVETDVYVEMDDPNRRLYCFCRTIDNGYMLGCEVCGEFYHCPCIKLSKRDAKKLNYVCPVCDLTQGVPRRTALTPPVELLEEVVREAYALPFRPPEITTLELINGAVQVMRSAVQQFLQRNMFHRSDVPVIKFYLRKVEGCDVVIPEVSQLRDLVERYAKYVPSSEVYCLCQKPATPLVSMVACDSCNDWFHFPCIKVTAKVLRNACSYTCPLCCYKLGEPYPFGSIDITDHYPPFRDYVVGLRNAVDKTNSRTGRKRKKVSAAPNEPSDLECVAQADFPSSVTVLSSLPNTVPRKSPSGPNHSHSNTSIASPFGTTLSKMLLGTNASCAHSRIFPPLPTNPGGDAEIAPPQKKRQRKKKDKTLNSGVSATLVKCSENFHKDLSPVNLNSGGLASLLDVCPAPAAAPGLGLKPPKGVRKKPGSNAVSTEPCKNISSNSDNDISCFRAENSRFDTLGIITEGQGSACHADDQATFDSALGAYTLDAASELSQQFPEMYHTGSHPFSAPGDYPLFSAQHAVPSIYPPVTGNSSPPTPVNDNVSSPQAQKSQGRPSSSMWPVPETCSFYCSAPFSMLPSGSPFCGAPLFSQMGFNGPIMPVPRENTIAPDEMSTTMVNHSFPKKSPLISPVPDEDLGISKDVDVEPVSSLSSMGRL